MLAEIEIRPMRAGDIPGVIDLASGLTNVPHYARSTWQEMAEPGTALRRVALVAAGPAGELHGFAVASLLPPQAELETIAVARASQRRGIARGLLQCLAGRLSAAGAGELWLEVRLSNRAAISLYRGMGFVETGRRPGYYADPVEDALMMSLPL